MSNILNLLSEETFIEKMDRQNELLCCLVQLQNGAGFVLNTLYSWEEVQRIVRLGMASTVFKLGAQFSVNWNGEELCFDVVSFDTAVPADSKRSHSMTLMLHNVPWSFEFNTITDSLYKNSTIRQWLNSSESAGNWWSSINNNTAPSYADIDGFMKGFDSDFLNVIGKVKVETSIDAGRTTETTEDYFYLPSLCELGYTTVSSKDHYLYPTWEGSTFGYRSGGAKYDKESNAINWFTRTFQYYYYKETTSSGKTHYYSGLNNTICYIDSSDSTHFDYTKHTSPTSKLGICPVCNII